MLTENKIPKHKLTAITDRPFMLRHNDDGTVREHTHCFHRDDFFLIGVVISGRQHLSVDFEKYELKAGNAIIIFPGQIHASEPCTDTNGFALLLSPELLSDKDLLAIRELQFGNKIIELKEGDLHDIIQLYKVLKKRHQTAREIELSLVNAIKHMVIANITPDHPSVPNRYIRLVLKFQQLMEENIRTVKSPTEYASMLNVSGVYLNEATKSVTGKNASCLIGEYVTMLAKRELCYTKLSAQEIALNLGYVDYSYFSRLFSRHASMSPKSFRYTYIE